MSFMSGDQTDPWYTPDWLTPGQANPDPNPAQPAPPPAPAPAPAAATTNTSKVGISDPPPLPPVDAPKNNNPLFDPGTDITPGKDIPLKNPVAPPPPAVDPKAANHAKIDAALANAKSSDDKQYWYDKIDGDPNGYGSAWDYWQDRINRGDGAQLGLPRFQDGPGAAPNPHPTFPGNDNIAIGTDPTSLAVDAALKKLLDGGGTVHTAAGDAGQKALLDYFARGGNANQRLESIREKMGLLSRAQMNDARGDLASRGLLSEGSTSQGAELSTLGRVNANIAQQTSTAARDALIADDQEMQSAIQTATGLDQNATKNLLDTTKTITDRQQMLSDLALKSLDQNIQWQEFLANYGLSRDKLMYDIQNGQIQSLIPLIQAFIQWAQTASQGYN